MNLEGTVFPAEEVIGVEAARIIQDLSKKVIYLTRRIRYLEGIKTTVEEDARTPVEELPRSPASQEVRSEISVFGKRSLPGRGNARVGPFVGIDIVVGETKDWT